MERITLSQVDHTKLKPGLYVAGVNRFPRKASAYARMRFRSEAVEEVFPVTTFDLRLIPPNDERFSPLQPATIHTIEHIGGAFLRNDFYWNSRLIHFGPMSCRTGFFLVLYGELSPNSVAFPTLRFQTVRELLIGMCWDIMQFESCEGIPDATKEKCGNYLDHNVLSARIVAHNYYGVLSQSPEQIGYNQFTYPD